jgi:hypothetical protein
MSELKQKIPYKDCQSSIQPSTAGLLQTVQQNSRNHIVVSPERAIKVEALGVSPDGQVQVLCSGTSPQQSAQQQQQPQRQIQRKKLQFNTSQLVDSISPAQKQQPQHQRRKLQFSPQQQANKGLTQNDIQQSSVDTEELGSMYA